MIEREQCNCDPAACFDPKHQAFWMPENWPGGLAPVEQRIERRPNGDFVVSTYAWFYLKTDWPDAWPIALKRGELGHNISHSTCDAGGIAEALDWQRRNAEAERNLHVHGGLGLATEALLETYEAGHR